MRRAVGGLAVALVVAALPQAAAALLVWTFVVLPLAATAGQSTAFTMTATNVAGPDDLGCMEVTLPSTFMIDAVGDPVATNGDDWMATLNGTTVEVRSLSGGGRLNIGESVTFQVTATPTVAGVTSWPNHAHRQQDCSGLTEPGLPVQVVVLPALVPTPTPRPTATPTPRPTVRPSPIPSLPVSLPPLPSFVPSATPLPTAEPSDRESARARPSPSAPASVPVSQPPASPTPPVTPAAGGAGGGPPSSQAPRVVPDPGTVRLDAGTLTMLNGFDTWSVPAAVVGVPGLLVVLWVALQTVGALAWIPAVRRMRGHERGREPRVAR